MSLWAMFLLCMYLKAYERLLIIFLQVFSGVLLFGWAFMKLLSEMPDRYSIIIFKWLFVSTTSMIFKMLG